MHIRKFIWLKLFLCIFTLLCLLSFFLFRLKRFSLRICWISWKFLENLSSRKLFSISIIKRNSKIKTIYLIFPLFQFYRKLSHALRHDLKFEIFKGAVPGLRQILATESPLKMMKGVYFNLKALFVLKIFKFLSWHFEGLCISRLPALCLALGPGPGPRPWPPICIYRPWRPIFIYRP